jgi:isoleucyl-tRNA synthetase
MTVRTRTKKQENKKDLLESFKGPLLEDIRPLHNAGFFLSGELEDSDFDEDSEPSNHGDMDKIAIIETNRAVRAALEVSKTKDLNHAAKSLEAAQVALTRAQRAAYHSPSTQAKLAIKLGSRIVNHARLLFQESKLPPAPAFSK